MKSSPGSLAEDEFFYSLWPEVTDMLLCPCEGTVWDGWGGGWGEL